LNGFPLRCGLERSEEQNSGGGQVTVHCIDSKPRLTAPQRTDFPREQVATVPFLGHVTGGGQLGITLVVRADHSTYKRLAGARGQRSLEVFSR
jgi:hypothetical protein